MADLKQLESAFLKADEAGDTESAQVLANEIIRLRQVSNNVQSQMKEVSQDTWSQYFNGQLSLEDKMNLENQVKAGQIKLPPDITANISNIPTSPERPQDTGVSLQKEYTPMEKLQAGVESLGSVVSGATTGAIGSVVGATTGIIDSMLQGTFGTMAGAKQAQKTSEELAQAGTYQPESKLAQEYTQNIAKVVEPLTAIAPTQTGISNVSKAVKETPSYKYGDVLQGKQQTIEQTGIKPMTSDIIPPTTGVGKVIQSSMEKVPLVGTGGQRVSQQGQRLNAIQDLANELGYTDTNVINNVTKDLLQNRGNTIAKYSDMKKNVFNKVDEKINQPVNVEKTINSIDEQINKINDLGLAENQKAITVLEDFKQAFQNKNLNQLDDLRKSLGNKLNDEGMTSVKDILEKSASKVYDSLKEDLGSHIKQYGDKNDFTKWQVANKRLSENIKEVEVNALKNVLNKGEATPEKINSLLFSKDQSTQKLLYKNLSNEGKSTARTAIINKIINDSINNGEQLSTSKFIDNLKKNDISINTFFKQKDIEKIKGLTKALNLTRRAEEVGLNPPTGVQLLPFASYGGFVSQFGLTGGTTAFLGTGLLAKAYESPAVSNILIKLAKAPKTQEIGLLKLLDENIKKVLPTTGQQLQEKEENK